MMAIRSWRLPAKPSLEDLLEVQIISIAKSGPGGKGLVCRQGVAAINAADVKPFRLVFSGGTALSRAHRLIRRMAEDIDLKLVSDEPRSRSEFRQLRDNVTSALLQAGFQFDPENAAHRDSGNASRYTIYRLPYTPLVTGEGALRPEIQIGTAVWPLRLTPVELSLTSFCAEAFEQPPEVPSIPCVSLVETVTEKFVALTRRAGAELADAGGPRDKSLVRHVYDLHVVRSQYDPVAAIALAREIMRADVEAYGHQFPAYRENPVAETLRAVHEIATDDRFAVYYAEFLRDMVYGEAPDFKTAVAMVSALAEGLREWHPHRDKREARFGLWSNRSDPRSAAQHL
jgi:Nucleotidyl transferase AbiEii toxin, Type IV TA system